MACTLTKLEVATCLTRITKCRLLHVQLYGIEPSPTHNDTMSATIVAAGNSAEALLSSCIPLRRRKCCNSEHIKSSNITRWKT
eukprot:1159024-Pelagomonas_calceolata.AAC.5